MGTTLASLFFESCRRGPERPAMVYRSGHRMVTLTWEQCQRDVEAMANWFMSKGFQPGDRVALLCETRPEWLIADLAMQAIGLVSVPIYPTLTKRQIAYILGHAGARGLIVSHAKQLDKAMAVAGDLPDLTEVLLIEPIPVLEPTVTVTAWVDALELGTQLDKGFRAQRLVRMAAVEADSLCSIIYTSGTTGEPKGVMLSHANFVSNVDGIHKRCAITPHDTSLSFLHLSHVLERITSYAMIAAGATIGFAGSLDTLMYDLAAIRPTVMATVPRVLEKVHSRIREGLQHRTAVERRLWQWALAVGHQHYVDGGGDPVSLAIADRLVLKTIRSRFGGRLRFMVCGGAPMDRQIGAFFQTTGIVVGEGYGLTETSPVVSMNYPGHVKLGTVGPLLPGVRVRIADDGEVCVKGDNVMLGYYNDEDATRDAFDADGWFLTGDIGRMDDEGYLKITDRKKELIVLSNGKKVAPQQIESLLLASPFIEQVLVLGDDHPYLTALIVPDFTQVNPWAYERGLPLDRQALVKHVQVRQLLRDEMNRLTRDLAQFERIKQFTLLAAEWTIDSGEMTPTLKGRRKVILANNTHQVTAMYQKGETVGA
ncbi:MAG: long-chain fatty acid--CoA ligase [Candidatus Sericytochromatia bacterium]|nr:long-chain fatty acid--CoA ligase [Candidatus Sericytochromatia bacterium]